MRISDWSSDVCSSDLTDAMTTDEAGAERQEIPLAAGRFQHFVGIDAHAFEDQCQFVDQRDVHVALGVFDYLGRLGHTNAGGEVGACADDAAVERIQDRKSTRLNSSH